MKVGFASIVVRRDGKELEILDVNFNSMGFRFKSENSDSYFIESLQDNYISRDMYEEILKDRPISEDEQFFEIIGDVHHESDKYWTDCGYEYDAREWLENEKVLLIPKEEVPYMLEDLGISSYDEGEEK